MSLPQKYFKTIDGQRMYGGFYTQKDIKDIVAYAAVRGIDVVPELDMPGHNHMATRCYPWLGCAHDGTDPLCVGNDSTLKFCKNVYKEVFKLFPYGYAEIGGDEVKRTKWESCPLCKARVEREGLKDMAELQSWFTREMEKFFNKHNRRLIGWDEILEGGVSPTATVNWWQGYHKDVVQRATDGGNEVICCPTTFCYFDYAQDSMTIKNLYANGVVPKNLTPKQQSLVKGIQANVWGEFIPTVGRMQYMVFPRMLALAEKAWTAESQQDWEDFNVRLIGQIKRLDAMKINYRPLDAGYTRGFNVWHK
jgi:hexosaminidase